MPILTDKIGTQSDMIKRFTDKREIASSDDAEFNEFMQESEPVAPTSVDEESTLGDKAATVIGETFGAVGKGVLKSAQELGNFGIDAADWTENFAAKQGLGKGDFINDATPRLNFADDPTLVYQPQSFGSKMVSGISQFMAPFGIGTKAVGGLRVGNTVTKFIKAGGIGAIVDATAFDPHEERLSNLINHFPTLRNPVTEFLASNPKDSNAEGRFKAALEGLGVGIVAEGLILGVKVLRASRVAKNTLKDTQELARRADQADIPLPKDEPPPVPKAEPEAKVEGEPKAEPKPEPEQLELLPELQKIKDDIKAERPSQQPLPKTTPVEAQKIIRGFEDVATEGKAVNINLDKIETVDDVKRVISKIGKEFPSELDEARRGVISVEETAKLADDLGMSVDDLSARQEGQAFNAENVIASRRILNASAENVNNIVQLIRGGDDSKVMMAKLVASIDTHRVVQAQVSGIAAEAGRTLRAFKESVGLDNATRNRFLDDLLRLHGGESGIAKIVEAIGDGSTKQISKIARKSLGRKLVDAANEVFINGLLSGPKTHLVNMISNTTVLATSLPERFLAEKISAGSIDSVAKGETAAMMSGALNGMVDGFRMAKKAFKTGDSAFSQSAKIELPFEKSVSAKAFGVDQDTIIGKALDFMGHSINIPTRLLSSSDEFMKAINYRMEVHAQAHRKAVRQQIAEGLSEADTAVLVSKLTENPDEAIKLTALNTARENTFTKPLADLKLQGFDASAVDKAIRSTPVMRVVAPFTKTNLNLVEFALNRTPFAKGLMSDIAAGGLKKDVALARVSFGMVTMGTIGGLTTQGTVTGRGPVDLASRKALEATGWKPYSIKIAGKYRSYDRFDPWGSLFGIAADTAEILGTLSRDREDEGQQLAIQAGSIVASLMTPEFISKNMNDFFDVINGDERKVENFASGVVRGALPFSSFLRSIGAVVDPVDRDRKGDPDAAFPMFDRILKEVRNTIPFMSDSLPPKRNVFGEVQTSFIPFVSDPDDLGVLERGADDPIAKEIQRLNMTGPSLINDDEGLEYLKLDMPPRQINKFFGGESVSIDLNPERYDKFVQLAAGIGLETVDQSLREALNEQITEDFPVLGDNERTDAAKRLVIKQIVSEYRTMAKAQLLEEDEDLEEKVIEAQEDRASKLTGEDVSLSF